MAAARPLPASPRYVTMMKTRRQHKQTISVHFLVNGWRVSSSLSVPMSARKEHTIHISSTFPCNGLIGNLAVTLRSDPNQVSDMPICRPVDGICIGRYWRRSSLPGLRCLDRGTRTPMVRQCLMCSTIVTMAAMPAVAERRPHYIFELPDKYVGWVQIIFNDPGSPALPIAHGGVVLKVPESGIVRTSSIRVHSSLAPDEFFYRVIGSAGAQDVPVPAEDVLPGINHGGFGVMDTGGRGKGYSWFVFIGPPRLRKEVPLADWTEVLQNWQEIHRNSHVEAPDPYPIPGRMVAAS